MMLLVMRKDVNTLRITKSESAEHIFGNTRQEIHEFTVLEFTQLTAKITS